jgi:putative DNA primase/helicase
MTDYSLEALREALRDNARSIGTELLGQTPSKSVRGQVRFGRKGSFALHVSGSNAGLWSDFESGQGGDLLKLIQTRLGYDFAGAVAWGRKWLGWPEEGSYKPPDEATRARRLQEQATKKAKHEATAKAEEQRRIKSARKIWDRSIPAKGTLAEVYLTQSRCISLETIPDCIRFDPVECTAVFAATTPDGTFKAIQRVYLTAEGLNLKNEAAGNKKRSLGVLDNAAVRLAGSAENGPVCLAEGPETGLSVWAATGHETWIALGGLAKINPSEGKDTVLCRDDDPRDSNSFKATNKTKKNWKQSGLTIHEAWPWSIRKQDKSDFNDTLKADGLMGVKARFDHITNNSAVITALSVSLTDAQNLLAKRTDEFFTEAKAYQDDLTPPPVHACCVTLGSGKTEAAINSAIRTIGELRANGDTRAIVIAVPEHKLSAQIQERICKKAHNLRVEVYRGREVKNPASDGLMCGDIDTVKEAISLFADIDKEVCSVCPLQSECAYLAQKNKEADIWIISHQRLFRDAPAAINQHGIAAIIVDESPWQAGLIGADGGGINIPAGWMDATVLPSSGPRHDTIREAFKRAVEGKEVHGYVTRQELINAGLTPAHGSLESSGSVAKALEWNRKVTDGPWRERKANKSLRKMTALWDAVDKTLNSDGHVTKGYLFFNHDDEGNRQVRVCGRMDIHTDWQAPTLLIDATMDEALIRPYWPQLQVTAQIDVAAPHQRIIQIPDRAFSKSMLEASDKPKDEARRFKNRLKIKSFVAQIQRTCGGKTLVVSNKAILEVLNLPSNTLTAHFNALAGHDQFKDVTSIIVIGRALPPPNPVERLTAALTGKAPKTLDGWYVRQDIVRRQRCGNGYKLIQGETEGHPDDIAEQIRRRITEGEIMQAIGRGRGVRRTESNPLTVFVLGDAALPIPVDEFWPDTVVMQQSQKDLMLSEGGIAFDSAAAAATAYPKLYKSPKAAEHALARCRQSSNSMSPNPYKKSLYGNGEMLTEVFYRRQGASYRRERAVMDLARISDPQAHLERILGSLAEFETLEALSVVKLVLEPPLVAPSTPPIIKAPPVKEGPSKVFTLDTYRAAIRDSHTDMALLAATMGVSLPHLSNMLRGRRRMTPEFEAQLTGILEDKPKLQGRLL